MSNNATLITGGAGYIGSHVLLQLQSRGEVCVVLDNLRTGFRQAVSNAPLIVGNVGDVELVAGLVREYGIDTVMHFAASTIVPESVREPLSYYANNTCATRNLLEACMREGVRKFVFSSTAAIYGNPEGGIADELSVLAPINPYGTSKLMSEWLLRDLAAVSEFRYVALRYFNVAGADHGGRIGQATLNATLLIKVACEAIVGKRSHVTIYGTDYPTVDGTGVRDYIHVEDLARAHVDALDYLRAGGASTALNCGYGHGYSVRQVLESVQRVAGKQLVIRESPRREGDPPLVIARTERIRSLIGWTPQLDDLDAIIESALRWEEKMQRAPW
jgi:UDP-glucose 4-epimerase